MLSNTLSVALFNIYNIPIFIPLQLQIGSLVHISMRFFYCCNFHLQT